MASAQVVETSVTNNSPSQDSYHPDDLFQSKKIFSLPMIHFKLVTFPCLFSVVFVSFCSFVFLFFLFLFFFALTGHHQSHSCLITEKILLFVFCCCCCFLFTKAYCCTHPQTTLQVPTCYFLFCFDFVPGPRRQYSPPLRYCWWGAQHGGYASEQHKAYGGDYQS